MAKVNSISDIAAVENVEVNAPKQSRSKNPNLMGVRAEVNKDLVATLDKYVEDTKLDRALVVEMALRTFFNVNVENRVQAYDETMQARIPAKANIR